MFVTLLTAPGVLPEQAESESFQAWQAEQVATQAAMALAA